ncbi:hypothetical protein [Croceicoccus gelatinilyticus]|uniref:hypothetical protein n=1 Tax=Croceicoccus gelatinilyticus TaxID=2835536 RepID=UPI001BCDDECF|nr:hypothetical protein [Croceicoccus gelatinilyticus]MBS7669374.1 hypothetical protein [Croceicoccus gelatinilyticus]
MTEQITVTQPRPDTFSGDNAKLIECIDALLDLDDAKALVPHGLGKGSHAYVLLNAARHRIEVEKRTANRDVVEVRMAMFLEIMAATGGETDAGDWRGNWINAFCEEHEGRDPDTFNAAANAGYISVAHCTSTDHSIATLTDKGRTALASLDTGTGLMERSALVEKITKAIFFEDCGNTEHWEANVNLGEAVVRALWGDGE